MNATKTLAALLLAAASTLTMAASATQMATDAVELVADLMKTPPEVKEALSAITHKVMTGMRQELTDSPKETVDTPKLAADSQPGATDKPKVAGNMKIDDFQKAKELLEEKVYFDHRVTLYCGAKFNAQKNVTLPEGFTTPKHAKRAHRVEWEHVVPAENFGRAFVEWREGDEKCVDSKGRAYKGRRCAEKANAAFRYMQADLYNLHPAIGAVNAMRSNYRYSMLPGVPATFGTCSMKIDGRRAEPPEAARGTIARTVLYMADAYQGTYRLSRQDRQLMEAWDRQYPVDQWECTRARRIEAIQGNPNERVKEACSRAGL